MPLTPDTGATELELEDGSFSQLPVGTLQPLPCVHLSLSGVGAGYWAEGMDSGG